MSLYIPNLNFPPNGKIKTLVLFDDGIVLDNENGQIQLRAAEVAPHGRLIDADELRFIQASEEPDPWDYARRYAVDATPTIIPADPEGGGTSE